MVPPVRKKIVVTGSHRHMGDRNVLAVSESQKPQYWKLIAIFRELAQPCRPSAFEAFVSQPTSKSPYRRNTLKQPAVCDFCSFSITSCRHVVRYGVDTNAIDSRETTPRGHFGFHTGHATAIFRDPTGLQLTPHILPNLYDIPHVLVSLYKTYAPF